MNQLFCKKLGGSIPSFLSQFFIILFIFFIQPFLASQTCESILSLDPQDSDFMVCLDKDAGYPDCAILKVTMDLTQVDFSQYNDPLKVAVRLPYIIDLSGNNAIPLNHENSNVFFQSEDDIDGNVNFEGSGYEFIYEIDDETISDFEAEFTISSGEFHLGAGSINNFEVELFEPSSANEVKILEVDLTDIDASEWFSQTFQFHTVVNSFSSNDDVISFNNKSLHLTSNGSANYEFEFLAGKEYIFSNVEIYPNMGIPLVLKSGTKVTIDDCLISGCERLWETIILEQGAELIIKDSEIRDGYKSITLTDGGEYELLDNVFSNNFISFFADGSYDEDNSISITDVKGNIIQSDFNEPFLEFAEGMLGDPQHADWDNKSYAGLYSYKANVDFMYSLFHSNEDVNHFNGLHFGAVSEEGRLRMSTSRFTEILKTKGTTIDEGAALLNKNGLLYFRGGLIVDGAQIEDCKFGFLSRNGLISSIRRSKIVDCKYGVFLEDEIFLGRISNNNILESRFGVRIVDRNRVTENVSISGNEIEAFHRGVWISGMSASIIKNNIFVDGEDVQYSGSASISYNSFEIGATDTYHARQKPRIISNTIKSKSDIENPARFGIIVNGGYGFHILDNIVEFSATNRLFDDDLYYGMYFNGGKEHQIRRNCILNRTISRYYPGSDLIDAKGIFIREGLGFTVRNNKVNRSWDQVSYIADINLSGNLVGLDLAGNRMREFNYLDPKPTESNLLLGTYPEGDNARAITGAQRYRSNMWAYESGSLDSDHNRAKNLGSEEFDFSRSKFYIDSSNYITFFVFFANPFVQHTLLLWPYPNHPNDEEFKWIIDEAPSIEDNEFIPSPPICRALEDNPGEIEVNGPFFADLTPLTWNKLNQSTVAGNDSLDLGQYSFIWKGRRYLYEIIKYEQTRNISYSLDSATMHWGSEDFAILADVRHGIAEDLYSEDQDLMQWLNPNDLALDSILLDSIQLDSMGLVIADSVKSRRGGIWQQFMSDNVNFTAETPAANLEATVNKTMSQWALGTSIESQMDSLFDIATSCGMTEGSAVYEARALINGNLDSIFVELNPCLVPDSALVRESPRERKSAAEVEVYPNPTNEQITVTLDKNWERADLILYDIQGRALWTKRSVRSGSTYGIPRFIPAGAYYLFLENQDKASEIGVVPLIIQR